VHVTISIGVAHRDGHHASSSAVMSTASKALHRAKQLGRNLVVEQKRAR
jgi:PleD family two-component response regulator